MTTEPERAPLPNVSNRLEAEVGPHAHHPLVHFRLFEQLKQRNVFRVAALYLVVCWLILEPVHVVFHMLDVPVWATRLVLLVMAIGFPAAVIFAWVYEITPEGLKPTVEVPHGQSIRRLTGRRLDRAIIAVLVIALAYFVVDKFWLTKRTASSISPAVTNRSQLPTMPEKSIAVLPFVDLSEKHDQEYFGDGMAEEILDILAKVPSLKVIGRTSSFQFKGRNEDLRKVGTSLGVAYVLEGSVRRSADRVRVTTQLIDTRDGAHVWSESYDRPVDDALRMQGEIAVTLARSLEIGIGADSPQSRRRLKNDAAYDLYLRGRYAAERGDADGMATGITYLREALDADPGFAAAAVALALTYYNQAFTVLTPSSVFEASRQAAKSALKLDPNLGLAHAILGAIHNDYDWDWAAADREFKLAITLAPHDGLVWAMSADYAVALGHLDAARQMLKQALAYDPLLADAYSTLSWTEWCAGHYDESLAAARKVLEIDPTYDWGYIGVGYALLYRGDAAAAITEFKRQSNPMEQANGLALAYHALSREGDSDAALAKLITGAQTTTRTRSPRSMPIEASGTRR
jgi:adenylate cyclase